MTDEHALAYLAGIIDGEGCINLNRRTSGRSYWRLRVSMTTPQAIDLLHKTFGGRLSVMANRPGNRKDCKVWELYGQAVVKDALEALLPHLRVKRDQALIALESLELPTDSR